MTTRTKERFADLGDRLGDFEYDGAGPPADLAAIDPGEGCFTHGDKARDKAQLEALAAEIDELQNAFYADRRFKLLIVLQGTDTSGKDGTLRAVFSRTTPLGVRTVSWRAPSDEERRHDYLWRIHREVPGAGEITVFNRSHYEDVLVPWVGGAIDDGEAARRWRQINDFERMLSENGTTVLKFMLHISKDVQRKRLQQRLDDPSKRWKFERSDLEARLQWDAFQHAYGRTLAATSTPWAPWTIVPADSKTQRNLLVATSLCRTLKRLDVRYPAGDPELANLRVE